MTDRGRDENGNPYVLWISKEAVGITIEDTHEGEGVKYILADTPTFAGIPVDSRKAVNVTPASSDKQKALECLDKTPKHMGEGCGIPFKPKEIIRAALSEVGNPTAPLDPDMPAQELMLHMGELTESEARVARAAINWANSFKVDHLPEIRKMVDTSLKFPSGCVVKLEELLDFEGITSVSSDKDIMAVGYACITRLPIIRRILDDLSARYD